MPRLQHNYAMTTHAAQGVTVDEVAAIVLKGIDRHKRVILTDRLGRQAFWTKRLVRPAYNAMATKAGQKLARKSGDA